MNTPASLTLTVIAAAAAGASTSWLLAPEPAVGAESQAVAPDQLAALTQTIEELRSDQQRLRDELSDASRLQGPARLDMAQLESTITRLLDERQGRTLPASVELVAGDADPKRDLRARLEGLFDLDEDELTARWKELREAGLEDEALEYFQALADGSPSDPEAQFELGQAYIMKLQALGSSPEAGKVATLADKSFDRALDLDPNHWDARFTKAVALSFWPPIFGKQAEAIEQFEILVGQQATQTPQSGFANTHLLLGNLYQQLGQQDKATAAWQAGSQLFPDNEDLSGKLNP